MIAGIVLGIVAGLLVNELCEFSPWCARKLVRWSALRRYTDPGRAEMRAEELTGLINDRPGNLLKLTTAVGFAAAAVIVAGRRALTREPDAGTRSDPALPAVSHTGMLDRMYDVVLAPTAHRVLRGMNQPDSEGLTRALRMELANGPNASGEIRFGFSIWADPDPGDRVEVYTATPLTFGKYTVVHRQMTEAEMRRLALQSGRAAASRGFYVIDILPAEAVSCF